MISVGRLVVATIEFMQLSDNDWQAGPGWTALNQNGFFTMWAISFYMFEGVTSLLPVYEASEYKQNFIPLLIGALCTLLVIHIFFSSLSYYNFGDRIDEPLLIEKMPQDNPFIIIGRLLYLSVIVYSYPLTIYVVNNIIEGYIFKCMRFSVWRTWLKNLSRTIIVIASVTLSYLFYY